MELAYTFDYLIYMETVRDSFYSIAQVKLGIRDEDWCCAVESWEELDEGTRMILWRAPSKGGIFTTEERAAMRSNEWSNAANEQIRGA